MNKYLVVRYKSCWLEHGLHHVFLYIDQNSTKNASKLCYIGSHCSRNDENYDKVEFESNVPINLSCDPRDG